MATGQGEDKVRLHQEYYRTVPNTVASRAGRPPHVIGCHRARLVPGVGWTRCGRPSCSRKCRNLWGRRKALAMLLGIDPVNPPTIFVTLTRPPGSTVDDLRTARSKALAGC